MGQKTTVGLGRTAPLAKGQSGLKRRVADPGGVDTALNPTLEKKLHTSVKKNRILTPNINPDPN